MPQSLLELDGAAAGAAGAGVLDELPDESDDEPLLNELDDDGVVLDELPRLSVL